MKKWVTTMMATAMVMGAFPTMTQAAPFMHIIVNGQKVQFPDSQPFVDENNRTMVPVRFITESLGAKVNWNQSTLTADIALKDTEIKLTVGEKRAFINGVEKALDTQVIQVGGRTYVPLRFVTETLGGTVGVSGTTVTIDTSAKDTSAKYDPWGRLIRTTNLPNNYKNYQYILADVPNEMYEMPFNSSDVSQAQSPSYLYANVPEFTKYDVDIWMNNIRKYYDLLLNVDYRTIDYSWANNIVQYQTNNSDLSELKSYVDWVKKNHIRVEGYVDPEPSMIYSSDIFGYETRSRFMIKVDSYDQFKSVIFDQTIDAIPALERGVWYEGYTDIELATNYWTYWGEYEKVSNGAWLFDSIGSQHYYKIWKSE